MEPQSPFGDDNNMGDWASHLPHHLSRRQVLRLQNSISSTSNNGNMNSNSNSNSNVSTSKRGQKMCWKIQRRKKNTHKRKKTKLDELTKEDSRRHQTKTRIWGRYVKPCRLKEWITIRPCLHLLFLEFIHHRSVCVFAQISSFKEEHTIEDESLWYLGLTRCEAQAISHFLPKVLGQ